MSQKTLSVKLSLNDKQFQSGLRKATKSLKKFGKSMQKTGKQLSTSLTLPVLAFGAASVKAFDEQIKAETKLRTALKEDEKTFQRLTKAAQDFQKVSLFGDEEIITQQAYLASLGMTEETINKVIAASLDLSAGTGQTLEFGVKNLAKTFAGLTGELGESIPALKELTKEQLIAGAAVDVVSKAFEGQALALTKVGLGPYKQIQMALSDVSEEFGRLIVENIDPLRIKLEKLTESFASLTTEQKENIVQFGALAAIVGPFLIILGNTVEILGGLTRAISFLAANPIVLLISAIGTLTAAMGLAILDLETFTEKALKLGRVGRTIASGILNVLGPNSAEMQAARALLAMDFDDFEGGGPVGHREDANATFGGTKTTTATTTKVKSTPTRITPKAASPIAQSLEMIPILAKDATGALQTVKDMVSPLDDAFASFGMTMRESFMSAMNSSEGFFDSFLEGAKRAMKALLAQIAAMAVLTFFLGGTNLGSLMGAGNVGGIGGVQNMFNPFTAKSGMNNLISPNGGGIEVFGTISGADILLSSNRSGANRNRTSGYSTNS